MARQVKCKICGEKIASDTAYCIEKINEKTGKKTRSYYCSEEKYSREQLYNCLRANADSIKMYLNQKDIYEEYGKLSYITNTIKNKIKDYSQNEQIQIGSTYEPMDCLD